MPQRKLAGEGALGCSSHDPVIVPHGPWGGDELISLWLPSLLHARCFVMRQEEEWEQVIQGLWGPGQAQVSLGAGGVWGRKSRAVRQGAALSASHGSSREVGAWEPSARHCGVATGHGWGER